MKPLKINEVFEITKKRYFHSEVTSGEFIFFEVFLQSNYSREEVAFGVQEFLDWDESNTEFEVVADGRFWAIEEK